MLPKSGVCLELLVITDKKSPIGGVSYPLIHRLSVVECGLGHHSRPLKATINHPSVDTVWTLSGFALPFNGLSDIASCKYSGAKCA